jgi:outer membrane protein
MKPHTRVTAVVFCFLGFSVMLLAQNQDKEKPLAFRAAIELALRNSSTSAVARADLQRARATVTQTRDLFLPQMTAGSALGYSQGFPLSLEGAAPSVFNVNIQEFLFNAAQRDYVRAAKSASDATVAQNADRRNDVIMETALTYMQLDLLESSLSIQQEQQEAAAKFQDITGQRVQAGLDSHVELTRAKLAVARTRLDITRTQSSADQLRLRLSQLTGLPVSAIHTATESIPQLPSVSQDDDLSAQAVEKNASVKIADESAQSKEFRARAERKLLYPTVDLAGQYAVLARFNNYDQFFKKFEEHNLTIGVVIRVPFLNLAQHAAAGAAQAEAAKAREEARSVKEQVSTEALRLQRSVQELSAARDVAQLEHQLAQADIEAAHAKIESGAASLKDEQNARVTFDLDKVQVQLLRQIGQLESWALGPKR